MLFLQSPAGLDRIEVGRIRRKIEDTHTAFAARRHDARVVMRAEVVHDEDISSAQLWEQAALEPPHEAFSIRSLEHGAQGDPAAQADRTEQRQVLAPVRGRSLDVLGTLSHPRMTSRHRQMEARLIEKDQAIDGDAAHTPHERPPLLLDVGP